MNILVPHSWLKEYLETNANPEKIGECLSLCGASVEKINKSGNDYIYNIEITTNRVDMMSILGIAREVSAILPQFGIKAKLKKDPYQQIPNSKYQISNKIPQLKVVIKNSKLCPRFTAIILENIKIKPSPKIIQERLKKVGVRTLNNAIDISNYLMHELGQPVHVFDYDKIKGAKMIIRESKKGEKLTTLDGKNFKLPGNDIVIEDNEGRLIDLCGIMGGENSAVDQNTKKVLLFVQNYEPIHIRKSSMALGQRTEAAALFEKNVDPELVMPTILKGIQLFKQTAGAKTASNIIDIYPKKYKAKTVTISLQLIEEYLGTSIQLNKVINILNSLGLKTSIINHPASKSSTSANRQSSSIKVKVPSWRSNDISIPEDLIEEVARIYGYHNLPSILPTGQEPKESPQSKEFYWTDKIKNSLKHWGLTETYTYSMQSEEEITGFFFEPKDHLKIKNPLTEEWAYMRKHLFPSILSVIKQNQFYIKHNKSEKKGIELFEISNVYTPRKKELPIETQKLAIFLTGEKFYELKGLIEAILIETNIKNLKLEKIKGELRQWDSLKTANINIVDKNKKIQIGRMGSINESVLKNFEIETKITAAIINFEKLIKLATKHKKYQAIPKYPPIIEDLTFTINPEINYEKLVNLIKETNKIIKKVSLIDSYKNNYTFRITYQNPKRNLTDKEIEKIRKRVVVKLEKQNIILKGKV